eukprot:TRINITY_DN1060_c0_g1_i3.p1 TRINITY_DN1060_c0_g1~~TRINITY_DN1060_c0_g1_i3.p1  ORF type:complete len:433 (+),score=150.36 TRINITY_DN1060_c0_g1_i3:271-1569(+)
MWVGCMLAAAALCAPEQIHLAHSSASSIWVSWLDSSKSGSKGVVELRGIGSWSVSASEYTYQAANAPSEYTSPDLYHAEVTGLKCGSAYHYTVSSNGTKSETYPFSMLTCAASGAGTKLAIIGDLGQTENATQTLDLVHSSLGSASPPEQLWILGDLSYADANNEGSCKYPDSGCSQGRWDTWGRMVEKVLARLPMQPIAGNHEPESRPTPLKGDAYLAFSSRFKMPGGGSAGGPFWYSWQSGNAHFISLNCYMDFDKDSEQYKWLEADLKAVDRSVTQWVFVATHAPWYNSNLAHQGEHEEGDMRDAMEALLKKYEVDILFCGHVHAYERTYGVFNGARSDGDKLEINIGDGGNREVLPANNWEDPQPEWSAFRQTVFGHGMLETLNGTHALWTWHTILKPEDISSDSVMLVKNAHLGNGITRGVTAFPTR